MSLPALSLLSRTAPPSTQEGSRLPAHPGVPEASVTAHTCVTRDGVRLGLRRFLRAPCKDVVLLVHGQATSSELFLLPEQENLVTHLLGHGFTDVWTVDTRMSRRPGGPAPASHDLDDVAAFDHPAAVACVRSVVGGRRLHVIGHGLGSLTFCMSLFSGAVEGLASVIAVAAALAVRLPARELLLQGTSLLSERLLGLPQSTSSLERACAPHTLHPGTHRRLGELFGSPDPLAHRHLLAMARAGHAVKRDVARADLCHLPDDYLRGARDVQTPVLLAAGAEDRIFTDSNVACFHALEDLAPGRHSLHVFRGHGHLDVLVGRDAARDVFPHLVRFLAQQRTGQTAPATLVRAA